MYKQEAKASLADAAYKRNQKARAEQADRAQLDDWNQGIWRNGKPMCVEFDEKGLISTCPSKVAVKYCWRMDRDKDWVIQHTACEKGEFKWVLANPGFLSYETRPWCRSYLGPCYADAVVSCAVAAKDVQTAITNCL